MARILDMPAYTDNRYTVKRLFCPHNSGGTATDAVVTGDATGDYDQTVTATNLGEDAATHHLKTDDIVMVFWDWDFTTANPTVRYWIMAPFADWQLYRITGEYSGNGYYLARTQVPRPGASLPAPDVDLDLSDYFEDLDAEEDDVVIYNVAESIGSGHILQIEGTQYVLGTVAGTWQDGLGNTGPLAKCDVASPMVIGEYNPCTGLGTRSSYHQSVYCDARGIAYQSFHFDDFVVGTVGRYRDDRILIDWNGFTIDAGYGKALHCHNKALAFDSFNPLDATQYAGPIAPVAGYASWRVDFDGTDSTLEDATCPPTDCHGTSCIITKKDTVIDGEVFVPKLNITPCTYDTGGGVAQYIDNYAISLGEGLKFTAPNILSVCIDDGDFTKAVVPAGSCCYQINVCSTTQTVATGNTVSASAGDTGAFLGDINVVCNGDGTITVTKTWVKMETTVITVLAACS
jgi:hypothetical protein